MSKKSTKESVTSASARIKIEEQTAAFLKSGGVIQKIDKGTSGQIKPPTPKESSVKSDQ